MRRYGLSFLFSPAIYCAGLSLYLPPQFIARVVGCAKVVFAHAENLPTIYFKIYLAPQFIAWVCRYIYPRIYSAGFNEPRATSDVRRMCPYALMTCALLRTTSGRVCKIRLYTRGSCFFLIHQSFPESHYCQETDNQDKDSNVEQIQQ